MYFGNLRSFIEPFSFAQATKLPVRVILPITIADKMVVVMAIEGFKAGSKPTFLLNSINPISKALPPPKPLNKDTNSDPALFFGIYNINDYIKILENSKEIHLLDSVWGVFVYQIDAKYGLFKNIPITSHCLRGYMPMFTEPIKLNNWIIK